MKKRATIEERMDKLRAEISLLEAIEPSRATTRRMLAGKRAALHVMEGVVARGVAADYCKDRDTDRAGEFHETGGL